MTFLRPALHRPAPKLHQRAPLACACARETSDIFLYTKQTSLKRRALEALSIHLLVGVSLGLYVNSRFSVNPNTSLNKNVLLEAILSSHVTEYDCDLV